MPKYDPNEHVLLAEKYARDGLSNEQIAEKFGISEATFYNWQKKHLEFLEAIKKGKKPVDIEVENALLKRARGYEYEEVITEVETGLDGKPRAKKVRTVKKQMAPDVGAIAFWLKNRNPEQWKEISRTDLTTNGKDITTDTIDYSKLSKETLKEIADARAKPG